MIGFMPELVFDVLFVSIRVKLDILLKKRNKCTWD
jgi:hypothetical protein